MGQNDENSVGSNNENKEVDGNKIEQNNNDGSKGGYKGSKPHKVNFKKTNNRGEKTVRNKEEITDVVKRRNKRLADFFKLVGLSVRVIGDENSPAIVLNDTHIVNAYVHNFELRFTDNPNQGNVIYTVKLTENPSFDKNTVMNCINDYEKRLVFKVAVKGSSPILYLSGYNFLNREEKLGRYPVFSAYDPKVYFSKEKTDEICDELNRDGYSLESLSDV